MLQIIIWPVVVLIIAGMVWLAFERASKRLADGVAYRAQCQHELDILEIEERRIATTLATATAEERTELEKAQLAEATAQSHADARVVAETIQDQIDQRRRVIASETEARVEKARLDVFSDETARDRTASYVEGYKAYASACEATGRPIMSMESWLGNLN